MAVSPGDTSCATINASTNYLDGSTFVISGQSARTQSGSTYAQWSGINAGSFNLTADFPGDYGLAAGCWSRTVTSPTSGTGMGASFAANGEVLTWQVGAVPPGAWVQTRGGDVYASSVITSLLPSTASPGRVFSLPGTGGYPGVVRYGGAYDFEIDSGTGGSYISATNWNANTTDRYTTDYYDLFWRKFGGAIASEYTPEQLASPLAQPASRVEPYYVIGDVTTSGNWVVADGETVILLINGNLTINGTITTSGSGFFGAIVKGNITVAPSVGTTYNSVTPVLKGVYMTSPTGTFSTGASTVAGAERLVGQGVFVAGAFELQRSLAGVGQDSTYASEYFIYDPQILLTMPDEMKETAVTWSEVAP